MAFTKEKTLNYIQAICKNEKIAIPVILFKRVGKGGACVEFIKDKVLNVQFDLNKIADLEFAILHELAHVILIRDLAYSLHGSKFTKLYNKLVDKYVYTSYSKILWC